MNVPTVREWSRLVSIIEPRSPFGRRDKALIDFLPNAGLRVGEVSGLDVEHVADPVRRKVRDKVVLPAAACKYHRSRTIPLNRAAQLCIREILQFNEQRGFSLAPNAPLLVNRRHERLQPRAIQRLVQKYREQAGLNGITPHKFRHLFASRFLDAGGNTRQLQVLLGHRWLSTVQVYTVVKHESLAAVMNRL